MSFSFLLHYSFEQSEYDKELRCKGELCDVVVMLNSSTSGLLRYRLSVNFDNETKKVNIWKLRYKAVALFCV